MIYLDLDNKRPLYEQLYEEIKYEIISGKFPKNTALGSLRVMEKDLMVSRTTVDRAYHQLIAEGYIYSVQGAGYFVKDIEEDNFKVSRPMTDLQSWKTPIPENKELRYDFEYASFDSSLFPWTKWKAYIQDAILSESDNNTLSYESNKGNALLRESLCGFLHKHRGVNCRPEQVIICAGTQHAMEILTNLLPPDKNRLAFEEPGYNAMRYLFEGRGYDITSIPVLDNGVDVQLLANANCDLLYITPSHQFPTGTVTSILQRKKLLKWAYNDNAYIIENDYDSEFRYGKVAIPSLQSLDKYQKVIYTGTLSKILSPSIRCAYLILPDDLLHTYELKYRYFNSAMPSYHQVALFHFIKDGLLERHLRKISTINEKKYQVLNKAIKEYLSNYVEIFKHPAGVHTLVRVKNCENQNLIIQKMKEASVGIYGTKAHWYNQKNAPEDIFLMGFNSMSENDIREGCKKMADVLENL